MSDTKRPNILVIVADDHGLDAGCYGNTAIRTPSMDALAADGVRFTHAFCTASTCAASRSVILSGLHNHSNGMYGHCHSYHHFSCFDNIRSLPARLAEGGYRTARIGKFHVMPESVFPFDEVLPGNARSSVEMAETCRAFMAGDDPFFLYYCTADPHRSGGVAEELPEKPNLFGNLPEGYPGVNEIKYDPAEVIVPPFMTDLPPIRAELAQYYQSVSRLDQGIGRLCDILQKLGKYDDTLIIYLSDNGSAFPQSKTTLYEPGMRLPLIVKSPLHSAKGTTCDAMVNWTDLAPTILDCGGIEYNPDDFHGRSFKDAVGQEKTQGWDETFASHTFHEITMYYPMRVMRTRKHKFIWNVAHGLTYPAASDLWPSWQCVTKNNLEVFGKRSVEAYMHRPRFELYDLENDPDEVVNIADKPENKALLEDFCARLKAFQEQTNDPWKVKWIHE